jgi:4-hydroxymandelate oxidase
MMSGEKPALPPLTAIPRDLVAACDYERRARQHLDDNAWAYLQGGAADELTMAANSAAFRAVSLLPRMLADVRGGHTRYSFLGQHFEHPIFLAPVAYQKLFHPDGERATALAAEALNAPMVLSTLASTRLEEVAAGTRAPLWFQLYWQGDRERSLALVRRAEAAGYQALVFTVDAPLAGIRNREQRAGFALPAGISAVNVSEAANLPMLDPMASPVFDAMMALAPGWDDLAWLLEQTHLPVLLKGILHPADAQRAVELGVHGLIVSNHGGRVLDTVPAALDALPAIRALVGPAMPLLLDGGIRRGSDVFKAIALGASAVLIGRPYIHALATAGALGVAHLLRTLREELEVAMALCGYRTLADINQDSILLA